MKTKSSKKLDNLILYLSSKVKFNCLKKIAKLLYFIDFTNFEATSKSLTGLKYQKYTYGPMPYNYYSLLKDIQKRGLIELKEKRLVSSVPIYVFPKAKPNLKVFSKNELDLVTSITEKFKNLTAGELEKIAKEEPPYLMVGHKEEIPDYLAFYRNTFGEMDLENENLSS